MLTGQLQLNRINIGVGPNNTAPYPVFRNSDMRITTMKLKQRALTGKPQSRRLTTQTSPLQNRNLSSYPMEYTKTETLATIQQKWAFKKTLVEKMKTAQQESENWKHYGHQKFTTALKDQKENTNINRAQTGIANSRRHECEWLYRIEHNGPTLRGSILYGQRHATPNFYHQRPYSEPPIKYYQEKSKSHLNMEESLHNGIYDHRPFTVALKTNTEATLFGLENGGLTRNVVQDSIARLNMVICGTEGVSDPNLDGRKNSCVNIIRSRTGTPLFDVPLISLSEDALSEHSEGSDKDNDVLEEKVKTYDPAKPVSSLLRIPKNEDPPSAPTTPVPGGHVHKRRSSKHLKGPRCWVDDATVSSGSLDKDECEDDTDIKTNYSAQMPQGNTSTQAYFPTRTDSHNVYGSTCETRQHETTVVRLPTFICPSSEKKSRQMAIKEWLLKSNFTRANRNVPLL